MSTFTDDGATKNETTLETKTTEEKEADVTKTLVTVGNTR